MAVKTAGNAILQIEAGQIPVSMVALTDSGDHKNFNSAAELWSNVSGKEPNVVPNGLRNGGIITPSVTADKVAISDLTAYIGGELVTLTGISDATVLRGLTTDICRINSITITSAGAIAVVSGTDHTAFSETRGASGGPPWIPTGSIEIGQVRLSSVTAGVVVESEIYAVIGTHVERDNSPVYVERFSRPDGLAGVEFISSLPLIHSDNAGVAVATKKVFAAYSEPDFTTLDRVSDFVAPEMTYSLKSTPIYGGAVGAASSTLGQGSFTVYLNDGIADSIIALKGLYLWFKFFSDRLVTNKNLLCQGILGISRKFPADGAITAACTITGSDAALEVKP